MNTRRAKRLNSLSNATRERGAKQIPSHSVCPFSSGCCDTMNRLAAPPKFAVISAKVPPQMEIVMCTVLPANRLSSRSSRCCPTTFA